MERLRPVYETGVLRLLLRGNSMLYVALLRSTFDPGHTQYDALLSSQGRKAAEDWAIPPPADVRYA